MVNKVEANGHPGVETGNHLKGETPFEGEAR